MCGRVTLTVEPDEIAQWLRVDPGRIFLPRYNIAPTQSVPIVRAATAGVGREAVPLRWGFVPMWAPDLAIGNKMINARAETVFQKTSFRQAIRSRRCLVPVSGFYEWKAGAQSRKREPFLIRMKNKRPFVLAGMWEHNEIVPEGPVETFAILTTEANALMKQLHDRMPVIIADDAIERWLNPAAPDIRDLLTPYSPDAMEATPVSDYVNDASHEGPQCVAAPTPPEPAPVVQAPAKKRKGRDAPGQQMLFD